MGTIIYPTLPEMQPAADPTTRAEAKNDVFTAQLDETFARQLDNDFAREVRAYLHGPDTGLSHLSGEAALEAIAGALPALDDLKTRTVARAANPRQQAVLEPLLDTRLGWAAGTIGAMAKRASTEVDDASVAERVTGLGLDAMAAWDDPARLHQLGRTVVDELHYQGERRALAPEQIAARARAGLSDLYAGAVEAALDRDVVRAAKLYEHSREAIAPERQAALESRLVATRGTLVVRDIDEALAAIELDPAAPPSADAFESRAAELMPDDAPAKLRERLVQVVAHAQRRATRQWDKKQGQAGVAALAWLQQNPEVPPTALPQDVHAWLAPDQQLGLAIAAEAGHVVTDPELQERLDRLAVHDPKAFAETDLGRYALSLDEHDYRRLSEIRKAVIEGRSDPDHLRWAQARLGVERALGELTRANAEPVPTLSKDSGAERPEEKAVDPPTPPADRP